MYHAVAVKSPEPSEDEVYSHGRRTSMAELLGQDHDTRVVTEDNYYPSVACLPTVLEREWSYCPTGLISDFTQTAGFTQVQLDCRPFYTLHVEPSALSTGCVLSVRSKL